MNKKKEITKQIKQKVKELNVLIRKAHKMELEVMGGEVDRSRVMEEIT